MVDDETDHDWAQEPVRHLRTASQRKVCEYLISAAVVVVRGIPRIFGTLGAFEGRGGSEEGVGGIRGHRGWRGGQAYRNWSILRSAAPGIRGESVLA